MTEATVNQTTTTREPGAFDRDVVIKTIRTNLRRRSGKDWSVKGGRGTAWGWIEIDAPPRRCTWTFVDVTGERDEFGNQRDEEVNDPSRRYGHMSPDDRKELARLLGLETVHFQGVSIPASTDYRREYVARSAGETPDVLGTPYWD